MRFSFAAVVLAGTVGSVQAGTCPPAQLWTTVSSSPVPTNVQLRVVFPAPGVEVFELVDGGPSIAKSGSATAAESDVLVRKEGGAVVPTTLRRTTKAKHASFIVQPRSPLVPNTRYAVVVRTKQAEYIVSRFTTGDGPDAVPPTLDRVVKAEFVRWKPSSPPHWKDPVGSFVELTLGGTQDVAGYEVHELQAGEVPSDDTLRVVVRDRGTTLRFDSTDACLGADFEFPPVPKRTKSQPLHLWIRAFDAAGNLSPLREVTVDLGKQRTR